MAPAVGCRGGPSPRGAAGPRGHPAGPAAGACQALTSASCLPRGWSRAPGPTREKVGHRRGAGPGNAAWARAAEEEKQILETRRDVESSPREAGPARGERHVPAARGRQDQSQSAGRGHPLGAAGGRAGQAAAHTPSPPPPTREAAPGRSTAWAQLGVQAPEGNAGRAPEHILGRRRMQASPPRQQLLPNMSQLVKEAEIEAVREWRGRAASWGWGGWPGSRAGRGGRGRGVPGGPGRLQRVQGRPRGLPEAGDGSDVETGKRQSPQGSCTPILGSHSSWQGPFGQLSKRFSYPDTVGRRTSPLTGPLEPLYPALPVRWGPARTARTSEDRQQCAPKPRPAPQLRDGIGPMGAEGQALGGAPATPQKASPLSQRPWGMRPQLPAPHLGLGISESVTSPGPQPQGARPRPEILE